MTLEELKNGDEGIIIKVRGRGAFRKRITEMGFIRGKSVRVIKNAPLKDPIEYKLMDYNISLRRSEAALIDVMRKGHGEFKRPGEPDLIADHNLMTPGRGRKRMGRQRADLSNGQSADAKNFDYGIKRRRRFRKGPGGNGSRAVAIDALSKSEQNKVRTINIALVGNPNSGKTTIFNTASHSRERVGNYGGVTVDAKEARFKQRGYTFNITDLPGTYSITAYTPEELFVRDFIFNNTPDVVINVMDASNIERNLYLTTQLIDMDIKVIVALNMYDELEKKGDAFDFDMLGKMMGVPFVPTIGPRGKGITELFDKVIEVYEDIDETLRHIHINYGPDIEKSIKSIQNKIYTEDNYSLTDTVSSRFLAIKLLEKDSAAEETIFNHCSNRTEIFHQVQLEIKKLESELKDDSETLMTDAKYGFIAGALRETYHAQDRPSVTISEKIDGILTHNILGFPIFLGFMLLTFQLTFTLGEYPMGWIESFFEFISGSLSVLMAEGLFKDLLIDGVLAGVGGVIVFLPNILILFFMISLMEDTGYMARAAFIMDRLMHKIGLHGKSFIPLIMGFGCNVPAIMATRTLESKNDRILTMLIIPFMSCSARLPVYVLFISAFFPGSPGLILFLLYFIGVFMAIVTATVMKKTIFKKVEIPFVMELPPYRAPHLKNTVKHMWERGVEYLKKIGGIILIASVIIWALGKFPREVDYSKNYGAEIASITDQYRDKMKSIQPGSETQAKILTAEMDRAINRVRLERENERLRNSYIGKIGHFISPVIEPLGFDWKMGVGILTGLAAKEIVVSTMGILYHADKDAGEENQSLVTKLRDQKYASGPKIGMKVFSPLTAFSFMIFVLLYFPCAATIATIKRESGSWRWGLFAVLYTTAVAWIITFIIQQVASLLI